jgi:hypothetical protein
MRWTLILSFLSLPSAADRSDVIVARNIFCSGCSTHSEPEWKPPFELLSTLVCPQDPLFSRALLREAPGGEIRLYAPGDRVGKSRLTKVMSQSVLLSSDGRSWRLLLAAPPELAAPAVAGSHCEANRCTLDRAEVERMVARPELLAARAVATPDGFLLRLGPTSPLRKLGLTDGDRLRTIDGTRLDGMDAVLHLWPTLRKSSHFTISILRAGRPLTWDVAVQ